MSKPVLVTSAAGGRQGQTGRHVAELLLARGVPVRAFVRQIDERSDRLKALGADIFVGDFLDVRSVMQAVKGVSSISIRSRTVSAMRPPPWLSRHASKASRVSSIS